MPERILDVTGVTKRFQTTIPKVVREKWVSQMMTG